MEQLLIGKMDHAIVVQLKQWAWERGLSLEEFRRLRLIESARPRTPALHERGFPVPTD